MPPQPTRHIVCRLLGGSGRPPIVAVPTRKRPALFAPIDRAPADTDIVHRPLPLAA